MAIAYKSKVFSNSAANTSQALFTAVASNTLVKSIICNNDGKSTGTATLRINESGGTSKLIRRVTIASGDSSVELLYDVLALEAGDILYVTSTDTDITFIMSYAEDSEALVLQSIDVLSDVNTTGKADGDVLTWDDGTNNWVASTPDQVITTLNGLTDVTIVDAVDHDSLIYDELTSSWVNGEPRALDMPVYNGTGTLIVKGSLLKAVGAHGDKVSVAMFALGTDDPKYLVGIASESISNGGTGHARVYGEVRQLDTSLWPIGTILYASSTAGSFATTAPFPEIPVAMVIRQHATTGRIFVRTWVPGGGGTGTTTNPTTAVLTNAAYTSPAYPSKANYLLIPPINLWTVNQGSLSVSVDSSTSTNLLVFNGPLTGRPIKGNITVAFTGLGIGTLRLQVVDKVGSLFVNVAEFNTKYALGSNVAKLSFTYNTTNSLAQFAFIVTPAPQMITSVYLQTAAINI